MGADSLDLLEITLDTEEAFDIEIPDEDTERITPVGEAIEYISGRTNKSQPWEK